MWGHRKPRKERQGAASGTATQRKADQKKHNCPSSWMMTVLNTNHEGDLEGRGS